MAHAQMRAKLIVGCRSAPAHFRAKKESSCGAPRTSSGRNGGPGSNGDGTFVYTVTDNRITRLAIKAGVTDKGRVEVTAGLSEATSVVATTQGVPHLRTAVQPQMVRSSSLVEYPAQLGSIPSRP